MKREYWIKVEIEDLKFTLSPLPLEIKNRAQFEAREACRTCNFVQAIKALNRIVQYCLKNIEGLEEPFQLGFRPDGSLTDESLEDVTSLTTFHTLQQVCSSISDVIPDRFVDHKNQEIPNVKIVGWTIGKINGFDKNLN